MILRRVIAHFREQEVDGDRPRLPDRRRRVFVGMQVNNWNEARSTDRRFAEFTERLRADLKEEYWTYLYLTAYFGEVLTNAEMSVAALGGAAPLSDEALLISAYRATQIQDTDAPARTYDELTSTGEIGLIRDKAMCDTAIGVYTTDLFDRIASQGVQSKYRETFRITIPNDVQRALRTACGDRPVERGDFKGIVRSLDYPCAYRPRRGDRRRGGYPEVERRRRSVAAPPDRRSRNAAHRPQTEQQGHSRGPSRRRGEVAMILRRVIAHFRRQEWTAIFLDFLIVVVGVFIGLQVNNWNEARGERRAEIGYLAAMEEDVAFSIGNLEALISQMERQEEARAALYAYSLDPGATILPQARDRHIAHGLFHLATMNIRQVAYEALKGSGRLDAIGSPALISALQSLSAEVAEVLRREQDETQITYLFSDPLLMSGVDMAGIFRQPSLSGRPPSIDWLPDARPSSVAPEVMKTTTFRNAVLYHSYFTSARLHDVKRVLEGHRRIAGLIDKRQAELGKTP